MTHPDPRPVFGLSLDSRVLRDLMEAPGDIRDLALGQIQDVVNAQLFGGKLTEELSGYRKLYVDYRNHWRIVYTQRPAPASSSHRTEIHVVAVRPRKGNDVYNTVRQRLGIARRPASALAHAARTRSPQLGTRQPLPGPPPPATPATPPNYGKNQVR
ncbi:hypothetical protein ACFQ8Q_00100 [Streptomyces cyaneofuscatus]|uniref:hypothetical protein n=1 Tax=Streptomyces cyaneofuscatus TaxID=66883 RepID=UPI0036ADDC5B